MMTEINVVSAIAEAVPVHASGPLVLMSSGRLLALGRQPSLAAAGAAGAGDAAVTALLTAAEQGGAVWRHVNNEQCVH